MLEFRSIVQIVLLETTNPILLELNKGFNGEKNKGIFLMVGEITTLDEGECYMCCKPNVELGDNLKYSIGHSIAVIPKITWNKDVKNLLVFNLNNN